MKISIITPSFNRSDYLDETIQSVLSQSGDFELEYIIQDGLSSSNVVEIYAKWEKYVSSGNFIPACKSVTFQVFSEGDLGMYDAINKGFARSSGDIMAWLNSDDYYLPHALRGIHEAFEQHSDIQWIVARAACFNRNGCLVRAGYEPNAFSRELISRGFYRGDLPGFNWLSQDAMFWRKSLWTQAGPLDSSLKLVADFKLWQAFSKKADLVKINLFTGGYRFHGEQLTGNPMAYSNELGGAPTLPKRLKIVMTLSRRFRGLGRVLVYGLNRRLFRILFGYDQQILAGRTLHWHFGTAKWKSSIERILD